MFDIALCILFPSAQCNSTTTMLFCMCGCVVPDFLSHDAFFGGVSFDSGVHSLWSHFWNRQDLRPTDADDPICLLPVFVRW